MNKWKFNKNEQSMNKIWTKTERSLKNPNTSWENLKNQRDELKVQSHLAKAELKDEWQELEKKWVVVEKQLHTLQQEAKESTDEFAGSAKIVMDELSAAYTRIKGRLKD